MMHVPLLSNAYESALFAAPALLLESAMRRRPSAASCSIPAQGPLPAPEKQDEAVEIPIDRDARPTVTATPNDDDMETARTRPLRLDHIHL